MRAMCGVRPLFFTTIRRAGVSEKREHQLAEKVYFLWLWNGPSTSDPARLASRGLDVWGGSLGLDTSTHVNLDVMSTVSAWRPSMGPRTFPKLGIC